jgi:hypothetical protein
MVELPNRLRATCVAAALTASVVLLGACGGERVAAELRPAVATTPAPPPTEASAPTPTDVPVPTDAPEPVVTEPAPVDPEPNPVLPDDGDLLQGFLVPVGLLLLAFATVAVIAAVVRSRKRATSPTPPRTTPSPQSSLVSTAQWISDQLSLELLTAAPEAAAQRWSVERSRLDNVAIGAHQQFLQTGASGWQLLGQAMSTLAIALDTTVRLRAQSPPNAESVDASVAAVNRQRTELRRLLITLASTIDR